MPVSEKLLKPVRRLCREREGAFAVSFVLLSGFLFSLAAFGLEGSRYITERARLSDAMEQAALALTAENNGKGAERNYTLTRDYLRAYMRHDKAVFRPEIQISSGESGGLSYVEYRVSAKTLQESWLHSSLFPSFDKEVVIGDNGAARKFFSSVDVMFVTDFSNSMNAPFNYGNSKLTELKRIVIKLVTELYSYDVGNKAGFLPFDWGSRVGNRCDLPFVTHYSVSPWLLSRGASQQLEYAIDYPATIAAIPYPVNHIWIPLSHVAPDVCLFNSNSWRVPLTSDITEIRRIREMTATGNTLISSGVLLGTTALAAGKGKRKLLIIISDGNDHPANIQITERLMAAGMCDRIRQVLTTEVSVGKMVFVGIGYNPTVDWKRCVGDKNFYHSYSVEQLEDSLRRAIFEEVGHNTTKN